MKRLGFLSIALASCLAIGCNDRTKNETNTTTASGSVGTAGDTDRTEIKQGDKDFAHDLVIANMAEVELGKLAMERSANAGVKKFAQMMIDDHATAGDKLKAVASEHNVPVPTELDDKHIELRDKLTKLKGAEFDREYVAAMVDGHEAVANQLESRIDKTHLAESKTQEADKVAGTKVETRTDVSTVLPEKSDNVVTMSLNQWAAEAYPVVEMHLDSAKALDKSAKQRGK